ncbi:MAG: tetratricopeptide repeat protein [Candidatus Competibacteraceae bacterium]|nr:tetratricopeptide repeat protein [Candidatus Competibacteraceae bacterium]
MGKSLLRKKQYDEALLEFNAVLAKNPASINGLLGAGLVCLKRGQFADSLIRFRQAKEIDPLQPKPYLLEGIALRRLGHLEESERAFNAVLALDPRSHRALTGLGEVALNQKRYGEALGHLRGALRYNPQWLPPRFLIAKANAEQEKFDEAIQELQAILAIDAGQSRAYIQMARLHAKASQHEKAADILASALTKIPADHLVAHLKIGLAANEMKLYPIAESAFRAILALQPNRQIVQLHWIEALVGGGQLDAAEEALKKLPLNKQTGALAHKLLGDVYYQRGHFRIAVEEYRATVLSVPALAEQLSALVDETDEAADEDWEGVADSYQPSLTHVVSDQTERLRETRARRRDPR